MAERRPSGISRRSWFSLPRGRRIVAMGERRAAKMHAFEKIYEEYERRLCMNITDGLYGEAA